MKLKNLLRCIHRHTVDEHPNCFAVGDVVDERKDTKLPWWKEPGMTIGFLDIETDGLRPDFSGMLTWCIKEKDGDIAFDVITKKDLFNGKADERLVRSVVTEMSKYKILIGYYSSQFDLKYVRTKALHYDIPFPNFGTIYQFDLYYAVKSKLLLSRSSLDNACDYLNIEGKTQIDKEVWRKAKYGDKVALEEVLRHNFGDVEITEKLYEKLIPHMKWNRKPM